MPNDEKQATKVLWALTRQVSDHGPLEQVPITTTPFLIGRRLDLSLSLPSRLVSGLHAELTIDGDYLYITDLASTNGTYVNGKRVTEKKLLGDGELVQVADFVMRVQRLTRLETKTTLTGGSDAGLGIIQFDRLLRDESLFCHFQPIVALPDRRTVAYEVLGRSNLFGLSEPAAMFRAAAQLNMVAELSRLFQRKGIESCQRLRRPHLFLNTHPIQLKEDGVLEMTLEELREQYPSQMLTLEINEESVVDIDRMKRLRRSLTDLNIHMAYDAFGAGQARFVELVDAHPDYVKFDMRFIHGLDSMTDEKRGVLASLIDMTRDLAILSVAMGVETESQADTCERLGFDYGQGFYFGIPASAKHYAPAVE